MDDFGWGHVLLGVPVSVGFVLLTALVAALYWTHLRRRK